VVDAIDCSAIKVLSISFISFGESRVAVKCEKGLLAADTDSRSSCNMGFRLSLEGIVFIGLRGVTRSLELTVEIGV
jgi:hypothetical protein